jgi:hypothetical protein
MYTGPDKVKSLRLPLDKLLLKLNDKLHHQPLSSFDLLLGKLTLHKDLDGSTELAESNPVCLRKNREEDSGKQVVDIYHILLCPVAAVDVLHQIGWDMVKVGRKEWSPKLTALTKDGKIPCHFIVITMRWDLASKGVHQEFRDIQSEQVYNVAREHGRHWRVDVEASEDRGLGDSSVAQASAYCCSVAESRRFERCQSYCVCV